jgi:hypothetical protein
MRMEVCALYEPAGERKAVGQRWTISQAIAYKRNRGKRRKRGTVSRFFSV